jgi:hypothetical protein
MALTRAMAKSVLVNVHVRLPLLSQTRVAVSSISSEVS